MTNSVRKLLVGGAVVGMLLGSAAVPATASGGTPFDVTASLSCDGTISWSAQVGTEELQQIWVKVDFVSTISLDLAEVEGTYTGSTPGFDPFVAHSVLFRRLAGNDVEEQAVVDLAACPDVVPPKVTARTPAANATAVALGVNATATFSEAMSATTVTGTSVTLRVGTTTTGALIAAAVSYNATTHVATLNPTSNLAADTRYTVRLGTGNKDAAGNALAATSWTFLTGPAPTITARTPAANATGVSRTQNQTATFSENTNAAKITTTNVTLRVGKTATGALIGSVVSYNATTRVVTLNPNATLAANTVYTVRLAGLTDVAGNPLPATSWSFTTGA